MLLVQFSSVRKCSFSSMEIARCIQSCHTNLVSIVFPVFLLVFLFICTFLLSSLHLLIPYFPFVLIWGECHVVQGWKAKKTMLSCKKCSRKPATKKFKQPATKKIKGRGHNKLMTTTKYRKITGHWRSLCSLWEVAFSIYRYLI